MNQLRLQDKVTIITGAATGIGEAIAHKFAREGAKLVLNGLPGDPLQDVVENLSKDGIQVVGYEGDVSRETHATACIKLAIDTYGRLDVLINNAGVFVATAQTEDYPIEDFDLTVHNNIRSVFLMTRYALPFLQKSRGNIVSAGSESGLIGLAQNTPYGGTKAWIHSFMRGVAVEQAKHGVRANCVCPGAVDTAWTHKETGPMSAKMEKELVEATPLARRGTPEEIANVYAFLASDEASYVTGALFVADGGVTVAKGAVGIETPRIMRKEPEGDLAGLRHALDGTRNKPIHKIS